MHAPELLALPEIDADEAPRVLILPRGVEARSVKALIDEYRDRPERRTGTATLADLESLIAWINRFKDDGSAIFVDRSAGKPSITAIIGYHEAGGEDDAAPRFCKHRGVYRRCPNRGRRGSRSTASRCRTAISPPGSRTGSAT